MMHSKPSKNFTYQHVLRDVLFLFVALTSVDKAFGQCPDPGFPLNGIRNVTGYAKHDMVHYSCLPGFVYGYGDFSQTCAGKSWNMDILACTEPLTKTVLDPISNLCYLFSNDPFKDKTTAASYCQAWSPNGRLAEIRTQQQYNVIANFFCEEHLRNRYYMGANDYAVDAVFKYDSAGDNLTFSKWAPGHPLANLVGQCVFLSLYNSDGSRYDGVPHFYEFTCNGVKSYICETTAPTPTWCPQPTRGSVVTGPQQTQTTRAATPGQSAAAAQTTPSTQQQQTTTEESTVPVTTPQQNVTTTEQTTPLTTPQQDVTTAQTTPPPTTPQHVANVGSTSAGPTVGGGGQTTQQQGGAPSFSSSAATPSVSGGAAFSQPVVARQTSTFNDAHAYYGVDGNRSTCSRTGRHAKAWFKVALPYLVTVNSVSIEGVGFSQVIVKVGTAEEQRGRIDGDDLPSNGLCGSNFLSTGKDEHRTVTMTCTSPIQGRFIYIISVSSIAQHVSICDVTVT